MKTFFISTIVLSFFFMESSQAQYWFPTGARSSAMGNTTSTAIDAWSVNNNPAGMASIKQLQAGLFFNNYYYLKELSNQACGLTVPTRYGVLGINFNKSGNASFRALKAGIAYAHMFGLHLSAGIRLDILNAKLSDGYGSNSMGTFDAGIQLKLSEKLKLGAHIFNPVRAHLSAYNDERVPVFFNTGLSYSYSNKLLATVEVSKSTETPMELLTGLEYRAMDQVLIRAGVDTAPLRYSFGAGYIFRKFSFDISSTYHEILGFSPQASLEYGFSSR
jgi:hypothetical protein